jgi:GAF domain-containing protein
MTYIDPSLNGAPLQDPSGVQPLELLTQISSLFTTSDDPGATLQRALVLLTHGVAEMVIVELLTDDDEVRPLASAHRDPALAEALASLVTRSRERLVQHDGLLSRTMRKRRPLWGDFAPEQMIDGTSDDPEARRLLGLLDIASYVSVPLIARTRVLGAMLLARSASAPVLREDEVPLVENLGGVMALALDNALLVKELCEWQAGEERTLAELRRQEDHMAAVAAAALIFAEAGLDQSNLLETVARRAASRLGDCAIVRLLPGEGSHLGELAVYHYDPHLAATLRGLLLSEPDLFGPPLIAGVLESCKGVVQGGRAEGGLGLAPSLAPYLEENPVHSFLVVPLCARDRVIGTLSIWRERPGMPYDGGDLSLAQELANLAARVIGNARDHTRLASRVEELTDGIDSLSYELRGHLNTVVGFSDLLDAGLAGPLTARQREYLRGIRSGSAELATLIGRMIEADAGGVTAPGTDG